MRFDEFLAQYKQAHHDWTFGRIKADAAAAEIARLRAAVPSIDPPEKRRTAESSLSRFESEISPEAQERMARAIEAISAAMADSGSVSERVARAEDGMAAVTSIAREAANSGEEHAILSLNESLLTLIDRLQNAEPSA